MKWLKWLIWLLAGVFCLGLVSVLLAVFFIRGEITELAVKEINRNLLTSIKAEKVDFSVIRRFPKASLQFTDVTAFSPEKFRHGSYSDTLFNIGKLTIAFNLLDLLQKRFEIQSVVVTHGWMNILIDSAGNPNYMIWKTNRQKHQDNTISLNLQSVKFSDVRIRYENLAKKISSVVTMDKLYLSGKFGSSDYTLVASADGHTGPLHMEQLFLEGGNALNLQLRLDVNHGQYGIRKGVLNWGGLRFTISGTALDGPPVNLDLKVQSRNTDIGTLVASLPLVYQKKLLTYSPQGKLQFTMFIKNQISKTIIPHVEAEFRVGKGSFNLGKGIRMEQLDIAGTFSNGMANKEETSLLDLTKVSGRFGDNSFSGFIRLSNLIRPYILFGLKLDTDLSQIQKLTGVDSLVKVSGRLDGDLAGKGRLLDLHRIHFKEFGNWTFSGDFHLHNGLVNLLKNNRTFTEMNGGLKLSQNLVTEDLTFCSGTNHFRINATIKDFLSWVFHHDEPLDIQAQLYSPSVNVDVQPSGNQQAAQDSAVRQPSFFPDSVFLDLSFTLASLKIGKFNAQNVSGMVTYKPFMFVLRSVNFQTMSGRVSGGGVVLQQLNKDFLVRTQCQLEGIDIHDLFSAFNNFGQKTITDQHVRGILDGNLTLQSEWDSKLHVKPESILAGSSFELKNGELINFEPMMGLSRFIEVSELQHIYFSTLQNEIYIRNKTVIMPGMDINSSAFNISASGEHTFDNNFTYRVRLLLGEVLARKAHKAKQNDSQVIEPDDLHKMNMYLLIKGNMQNYKVSYDTRAALNNVKASLKKEKEALKTIFKEEFGGQTDSINQDNAGANKKGKPSYKVEFDEKPGKDTLLKKGNETKEKQKKQPFQIEWDDK